MLSLSINKHRNILYRVNGTSATSQCYRLLLHCYFYKTTPSTLLESAANLSIKPPTQNKVIQFNGIITKVHAQTSELQHITHCILSIRPHAFAALLTRHSDIYKNITIIDILTTILKRNNIYYQIKVSQNYPKIKFLMQYQQLDLDFIQQHMKTHNLHYYFQTEKQLETMIITDKSIDAKTTYYYDIFDPHHIMTNNTAQQSPYCHIHSSQKARSLYIKRQPGVLRSLCSSIQPLKLTPLSNKKTTCPLHYLQQNGNTHQGTLFYPNTSDTMLISFLDGDYQKPFALSCFYNKSHYYPFNSENINGIKTQQHNLCFNDQSPYALKIKTQQSFNKTISGCSNTQVRNKYQYQNGQSNRTVTITNGHHQLNAKAISLNCEGSSLTVTASSITLKSNQIQLLANNTLQSNTVRIGDFHTCPLTHGDQQPHQGGPILTGSKNVLFNGRGAARFKDTAVCQYQNDHIKQTADNIHVNAMPIAFKAATTMHGGKITTGSANITTGPSNTDDVASTSTDDSKPLIINIKPYNIATRTLNNGHIIYGH